MAKLGKNWKKLSGYDGGKQLDYPKWFLDALFNRGLKNEQQISSYVNPSYDELYDPNTFLNLSAAVQRIALAKENAERVVVYGDYDVDGITSTALMFDVLDKFGIQNLETYIPHREAEGYGLNEGALTEISKAGGALVVTVDCGITSREIIDKFADKLDFVVIDHHEISAEKLPDKAICVHPEVVKKGTEPQKLSACGMAFFVAKELSDKYPEVFHPGQEKWFLDLVALSTICDVVPLINQNRILAKFGLTVIGKTRRAGLKALCEVASVKPEEVSAYEVGFLLGPRLNAAGRLDHAKMGLELLLTNDPKKARDLARRLNELNGERQKMCERILEEAKAEIEGSDIKEHQIFLLSNKNWPRGVVGIIASKLADYYTRPVIVFEHDGETLHGSARSVGEFDITAALTECEDCLTKFGGHAKAAGLTVADDHFVIFKEKMLEIVKNKIKETDLVPELTIDTTIKTEEITDEMLELLARMEPFGFGNSSPVFEVDGVELSFLKRVGDAGQHLKFKLKAQMSNGKGESELQGIWFNSKMEVAEKEKYNLAVQPRYNFWNNRRSIELRVLDVQKSQSKELV
jgi:single-stranded-DNA-specific exonuclease